MVQRKARYKMPAPVFRFKKNTGRKKDSVPIRGGQNGYTSRMARVIAVGNLKGGTGKTTLAVSLACCFAARSRVSLIDADPQGAARDWTAAARAPVAARHLPLAAPAADGNEDARLRTWASRIMALRRTADLVVLDLPPQGGPSLAAALALGDLFVVPVTPGGAELAATRRALRVLNQARAARNGRTLDCVLVPNRVDRRTALGRALPHTLAELGEAVGPALRQRAAQMEAYAAGTWVGASAPDSEAHDEVRALAKFLAARLN